MTKAPERIWAFLASDDDDPGHMFGKCWTRKLERHTEYVRADLVQALEAENALLRELLADCAADLEGELDARYTPEIRGHPAMRHKYERDIQPVRLARAALRENTDD